MGAQTRSRSRSGRSPSPLSRTVQRNMSMMPTRNSSPEVQLRHLLHQLGLRYRLHATKLPGKPDVYFATAKVAVFVDGCFWHACPTHGVLPKNNREWWRRKLRMNRKRDHDKDHRLEAMGWLPLHVWEHEEMTKAAKKIERIVRRRLIRNGHA
jgi:DNA mismatch endonuclease (patch repair protein)